MVILLRSPRNKAAAYAKEFSRLGIPLAAARGGFYDSPEVRDLLALLQVLDNPLQDLPLLGVLRSPLVGLTAGRTGRHPHRAQPHGRFWNALVDWHAQEAAKDSPPRPAEKAGRFLDAFRAWRQAARQAAVSHCLETIIDSDPLRRLACDAGARRATAGQRRAPAATGAAVRRRRGESLPRFLRFVEAQQESEAETEPAAAPESDAVRLMSIHQSKGLEFPVVVVADLGKRFNIGDLGGRISYLTRNSASAPASSPPDAFQTWPSLPYWLARRRQKREMLGEEMRLLYVALTRAAQRLILGGAASRKSIEEKWPKRAAQRARAGEKSSRAPAIWIGSEAGPPARPACKIPGKTSFSPGLFLTRIIPGSCPRRIGGRPTLSDLSDEPDLSPRSARPAGLALPLLRGHRDPRESLGFRSAPRDGRRNHGGIAADVCS